MSASVGTISGNILGSYCLSSSAAEARFRSSASARSVAISVGTRSAGFTLACLLKIPARAGAAIIVTLVSVTRKKKTRPVRQDDIVRASQGETLDGETPNFGIGCREIRYYGKVPSSTERVAA